MMMMMMMITSLCKTINNMHSLSSSYRIKDIEPTNSTCGFQKLLFLKKISVVSCLHTSNLNSLISVKKYLTWFIFYQKLLMPFFTNPFN